MNHVPQAMQPEGAKEDGLAEGAKLTALEDQRVEQERLTAVAAQREAAEKAAAWEAAQLEAQRIAERVNAAKASRGNAVWKICVFWMFFSLVFGNMAPRAIQTVSRSLSHQGRWFDLNERLQ